MKKHIRRVALALAAFAPAAWAHPGHGMPTGFHWHATDTLGLAAVLAGALAAWWLAGGE